MLIGGFPDPEPDLPFSASSFKVIMMTAHALQLVDDVIDRSADFDRTLAEAGDFHPETSGDDVAECVPIGQTTCLLAYGELTRAKGKLVSYLARLMDKVKDPSLNAKRTEQVRYE